MNVIHRTLKAISVEPDLYECFLDPLIKEKLPNELIITADTTADVSQIEDSVKELKHEIKTIYKVGDNNRKSYRIQRLVAGKEVFFSNLPAALLHHYSDKCTVVTKMTLQHGKIYPDILFA